MIMLGSISALFLVNFSLFYSTLSLFCNNSNHYLIADCLAQDGQIDLSPYRKKNSKRPVPPWIRFLQQHYRKIVETSASLVERLLPKHIHATNTAGFELKVILFMVAFSFDRLLSI